MIGRRHSTSAVILGLSAVIGLCAIAAWPLLPVLTYSIDSASSNIDSGVGVTVIAPGNGREWEKAVSSAVKDMGDRFPVEVTFGEADPIAIHVVTEKLKARRVERIIIIPLISSPHCSSMHRAQYVLGLRDSSDEWTDLTHPAPISAPFVLGDPVGANPLIADVVSERASELSRKPPVETLVIVAEGAVRDEDEALWQRDFAKLGRMVKMQSGFGHVCPCDVRENADLEHRDKALKELRKTVQSGSRNGRVVVVPLTLGGSGLETRVSGYLKGLTYSYNGKTLLPHPKMVRWMRENVDKQLLKLNWERMVKDSAVLSN